MAVTLVALMFAGEAATAASPSLDPGQAKNAAQAKLVQGVERLKSERYREALDLFKEAYALVPSPLISYDLGLAYLGLGDDPTALQSFDEFLSRAPQAPAEKRHRAEEYRDQLRPRVAIVALVADVEGADLTVDGLAVGRVSLPRHLYLAPGAHDLVVRADVGSAGQARTVVCLAGQTINLALRLSSPSASATVATRPAGAPASLALAAQPPADQGGVPVVIQPRPPTPSSATPAHPSVLARWGVGTTAAGLGALGVGTVFGVMAKNDGDTLTQDGQNRRNFMPETEADGLRHQRLETVFLSVGALVTLVGVGLYAVARYREGATHSTRRASP